MAGNQFEIPRRALLVLDAQNEHFTGSQPVSHPPSSVDGVRRAIDAALAAEVPIVVAMTTSAGAPPPGFVRGTHEWELHPAVAQRPHDLLVERSQPGAFTGTGLDAWLRTREIDTVAIAGYTTHLSCDTTARQAVERGYAVEFLSDATATAAARNDAGEASAEELYRTTLVVQAQRFSAVMTAADWAALIGAGATAS
jgi:nicotinamidase-related amidase